MPRFQDIVTDQNENGLPGAFITVRKYPDGTSAPITADNGSALGNPIAADGVGAYYFNAPDGLYTLEFHIDLDEPANKIRVIDLTSEDPTLRADLAADTGFTLVKYKSGRSNTFARSGAAWAVVGGDAESNIFHFIDPSLDNSILDRTNTTDLRTYVQNALDDAAGTGREVVAPAGKFRLASQVDMVAGTGLRGIRPRSKKTVSGITTEQYGGTWFHLDHTGKGFALHTVTDYYTDFQLKDFGTYRTQPAPTGGWAPTAHDFDIHSSAENDINIEGVMLYNPTKGIGLADAGGRLNIRDLRGQPMQIGIQIDGALDVCRIEDVHFWPFWKIDTNVQAYTQANLDAIYSLRNDNPFFDDMFMIHARSGIRIGQSALGGTQRLNLGKICVDTCKDGIWVDNTVTTGFTGQFGQIVHLAVSGALGGAALRVDGTNCNIDIGMLHSSNARAQTVKVGTGSNSVTIGRALVDGYDIGTTNVAAMEAAGTSFLYLLDHPLIAGGTGTGTGGRYGGTGKVSVFEWRTMPTPPTISATSGTITTIAATGIFRRFNDTVSVRMEIVDTANGTGSGALTFALPIAPQARAVGFGRNINNGKQLQVLATTPNTVVILNYDNTYPVASGDTIVIELEYQAA
jgi:hypothetical protein